MSASRLFPVGGAAGLVGLVLLVLEATRALTGNSLGTAGEVLLWVGVGLVVVGGLLLLLTVRAAESGPTRAPAPDRDLDGGQPANG